MLYLVGVGVFAWSTAYVLGEKSPQPELRELWIERAEINPPLIYGFTTLLIVAWPATLAYNLYNYARNK